MNAPAAWHALLEAATRICDEYGLPNVGERLTPASAADYGAEKDTRVERAA